MIMDLKKKIKAFFTFDRRANDGFTLVELIVVIAILAILGGVAVPAYSGYVTKANKQADITLVSEIENALALAGYAGTFAESKGGYIKLSTAGVNINANPEIAQALIAVFGEGYADTLKLKYDRWGNNGLYNNLTPQYAYAVKNSSYMTGNRVNKLLSDVEIMTSMAGNLVTALQSGGGFTEETTLSSLFGEGVLNSTATKYGIKKDANETWEQWAAKEGNSTAYSNLLVLTAADEFEKQLSDDSYEMSAASEMIYEFSSFYAYAATDAAFSATLDNYMAHLNGDSTVGELAAVTNAVTGKAWLDALEREAGIGYVNYLAQNGNLDKAAFASIMAGIGNPSEEQAGQIGADLGNANLFTSGAVNGMYNDFLAGVDAIASTYDAENPDSNSNLSNIGIGSGEVVILFAQKAGQMVTSNSLPEV